MKEENHDGTTMNFWRLLSQYAIEVPAIQRDYVQGRGDKQSTSARTAMLKDILDHIVHHEPMSLNFIYGKVTPAENGIDKFIPLDGQQRLTTLYLIHWRALVIAKNPSGHETTGLNDIAKVLGRFSYQTRQTSSDFFTTLSEPDTIQEVAKWMSDRLPQSSLSEHLQDKNWFRPDFMFDPTIKSVLKVLDDIDERFIDIDNRGLTQQEKLWRILISDDCPIQFSWLNVNDIDNGDDLYIKMNARGKQLSDFENIKAELEKQAQISFSAKHYEDFCRKFDQEWIDFFWSFKGTLSIDERAEYDKRFMSFLNWFLWNQWATRAAASSKINTDYSMTSVDLADTKYRALSVYDTDLKSEDESEDSLVCDEQTLTRLERVLDYVSGNNAIPEIFCIIKDSSSADGKADYSTRMRLEAATAYLDGVKRQDKQPEEQSWKAWIRVIQHLSDAATMWQGYNTLGLYAQAVGMVEQCANHAEDITAYLATFPEITGFTPKDQIDEEEIKAWLLINAPHWTESLRRAEAIPYFEGKIGFLLDFVGITKNNIKDLAQNPNVLSIFNKYLALTDIEFNKPDTKRPDTELLIDVRRALLTKGDYSMTEKSSCSYLVDDGSHARALSWRTMLRTSPEKKSDLFRKLYDDILNRIGSKQPDRQNIIDALTAIADEYVWNDECPDAHVKPLVQHKGLWSHDYFGNLWQFRIEDGICYLPLEDNTRLSGRNHELIACIICEELKHDIPTLRWELGTTTGRLYREWKPSEPKYLTLCNADKTVYVGRKYDPDKPSASPVITVSDGKNEESYPDIDGAINAIKTIFK